MKHTVFWCPLLIFALSAKCTAAASVKRFPAVESIIVGGRTAVEDAYPYMVSLRLLNKVSHHFCAGSIISERYILTAAHCTVFPEGIGDPKGNNVVVVIAGSNRRQKVPKGLYLSKRFIVHKQYSNLTNENDIALLQLTEPIRFTDGVKAVPIASTPPPVGALATLAGWGVNKIFPSLQMPARLQEITNMKVLRTEQCNEMLPASSQMNSSSGGQLCTILPKGKGACMGDSGGGLLVNHTLVGIVSYGIPCALGYPDVFTSVAHYRDWIRTNAEI